MVIDPKTGKEKILTGSEQYGLASINPANFMPTNGLPTLNTPGFKDVPTLPSSPAIPTIGTVAPESLGYDVNKDSYAQAALGTLAEEQKLGLDQFTESLRNMGLRGSGTVAPLTQDFITKQTREKALLGGQLTEQARTGALNEANITGFLSGNPTMAREQLKVNSAVQAAGVDLNRYQAGATTAMEKERILQSADQLGLSRAQLESNIKQAEQKFNADIITGQANFDRSVKEGNQAQAVASLASSIGMGFSQLGEEGIRRVINAIQSGNPSGIGQDETTAYNMIMDKINAAPPEWRDSLVAAANSGFVEAVKGDIGATNWGELAGTILGNAAKAAVGTLI